MRHFLGCVAALIFSTPVIAGVIGPARYIDSQGVEIIHNRNVVPQEHSKTGADSRAMKTTRLEFGAGSVSGAHAKEKSTDARLHVSTKDQRLRDMDRVAILKQELASEIEIFQKKAKMLNGAGANGKTNDESTIRLKEEMLMHESNIRAINSELKRANAMH